MNRFFKYLSQNQVILALLLIVLAWFIIQIRDIIVAVFLAYIIMAAVLPIVDYLKRKRFPNILAVLIPYIGILLCIFLIILPLVPFMIEQIQALVIGFPRYVDRSAMTLGFKIDPDLIKHFVSTNDQIGAVGQNAVLFTTKIFGGFFSILTVFIVSFYLLLYYDSFNLWFSKLFHSSTQARVLKTIGLVNEKLGAWLRGQIILCLFIGLFSWIGLTLVGIPDPLPLALLAGLLEIVPTIGPILSAVPAVIVALTISPTLGLVVIGLYIIIQATENNLLVPKIMERAVGLNPVIVILAVMTGANLMGVAGALLAIPFVSFWIVVIQSQESQK